MKNTETHLRAVGSIEPVAPRPDVDVWFGENRITRTGDQWTANIAQPHTRNQWGWFVAFAAAATCYGIYKWSNTPPAPNRE